MLITFYIFFILFFSLRIVESSSECEKNTLPSSIEVTDLNEIILKCSKPKHSIIQRNRYQFFRNESWHFSALNFKLCAYNFTSDKCNSSNGEWISGINSVDLRNINVTCCYNDILKKAKYLKYFYIESGQKIKAGEISGKNGNFSGFAYISNVIKMINYDHSITFKVVLNVIHYQKPRLQIHSFNTFKKNLSESSDSKKESKETPFTDSDKDTKVDDMTSIDFGVCDNDNNNSNKTRKSTEKPCSARFTKKLKFNSSYRATVLPKNTHPFSRKLYQAPLRPGTNNNQFLPSRQSIEPPKIDNKDFENDDFSIDFGGADQCPFVDDAMETASSVDGEARNENGGAANANGNANANANANGNNNANANSNSNTNINSNSNSNANSNSNSNSNSQSNSQSNSNQNSQNTQNSESNSDQNSQSQQLQNNNLQIIQSQNNPINPSLVMPMPNVPFVQAPVSYPSGGANGAFNSLTGFAGAGGGGGGCFSGDTKVYSINGKIKRMDELEINDWIFSASNEGICGFSRIISWLHRMPKQKYEFIKFTLTNEKSLLITKKHYIYIGDCFGSNSTVQAIPQRYIEAEKIKVSDCLLLLNSKNQFQSIRIKKIEHVFMEGIYAPLTDSGNIIVNGILASCYSEIDSFPISSISTKLNQYFRAITYLFKEVFLESSNPHVKRRNEIYLIPGIEFFIKTLKTILYPNYVLK